MRNARSRTRHPLAGLFLVSFCSLVFEVAASRKAATFLGATAYVGSTLLAAFLAGIGLGSWLASWRGLPTERRARVCARLLLLGSLAAGGLAPALAWFGEVGPSSLVARGVLLAVLVLPVGLAVGVAFPVLTGMVAGSSAVGRGVARAYAADTVGAAAGALAAGFLLVPMIGLRATGLVAAGGLACIGSLMLRAHRGTSARSRPDAVHVSSSHSLGLPHALGTRVGPDSRGPSARSLLVLFFCTGVAALALEVAWIRLFALVIGTSLFSFSVTVAGFLAALGIGSHAIRGRVDRMAEPGTTLARVLILTGASAPALLLLTPVWERIYLAVYRGTGSVPVFQAALFSLGLASILIPAGLMGAAFSLGVRLLHAPARAQSDGDAGDREGRDPAAATGRLYGVNTLGGVLGALLAGLLILPAWGVRGTILLSAAVYVIAGCWLGLRRARATTALTACAAGLLILVGALPEPRMYYAPYYHGLRQSSYAGFASARAGERVLYRSFSPYGLVTVTEDSDYRYLRQNGRSEASTSPVDMSTQLLIAHVPLLLHPAPARVLNIGLGAGFTLRAIERHPEVMSIVQAELDPRIVEAAREQFAAATANALDDPRVVLRVTDARRLLDGDGSAFDVIVSEPSHLWVSGVSGLFTREFYRIVGLRLAAGGLFATWVPRYEMGPEDILTVSATLLEEFDHVSAFENGPADLIFVASRTPFEPSLDRLSRALEVPGIRLDMARAMQGFAPTAENLAKLMQQLADNANLMPASVAEHELRNTDDRPVLEFHTALAAISKHRPAGSRSEAARPAGAE